MKNFFAILVAAATVLFASASVTSCSKISSNSLAGTTWTANVMTEFYTLTFLSETTCSMTLRDYDSGYSDTSMGTYTKNGNSIVFQFDFGIVTATVDGNTMKMTTDEGFPLVFTKS